MFKHPVFLIGLPGSGKSTLAKCLAKVLIIPFSDTDDLIEQQENTSIASLFEQLGEMRFRELEAKTLSTLLSSVQIVATGGGTPCFFDNMDRMLEMGLVVYVNTSLPICSQRIASQSGQRPMFKGLTADEISLKLASLLEKRAPFYEQADLQLKDTYSEQEAIQAIILAYRQKFQQT